MKKKCAVCDGKHLPRGEEETENMFGIKDNVMHVNIMATGDCYCAGYTPQVVKFRVNYCPVCGRKLEVER
jgi:hypothetical protein